MNALWLGSKTNTERGETASEIFNYLAEASADDKNVVRLKKKFKKF